MDRKVIWSETAWKDLEQIADYISSDSIHYAAAFVREMRDAARSLAKFSERGRIVPEIDRATIREIFVRNYRLIYLFEKPRVCILGIIHGSRDLSGLWQREGRPRK